MNDKTLFLLGFMSVVIGLLMSGYVLFTSYKFKHVYNQKIDAVIIDLHSKFDDGDLLYSPTPQDRKPRSSISRGGMSDLVAFLFVF